MNIRKTLKRSLVIACALLGAQQAAAAVRRVVGDPWTAIKWSSAGNWFEREIPKSNDTVYVDRVHVVQGFDLTGATAPALNCLVVSNTTATSTWDPNFTINNGSLTVTGDAAIRNEMWSNGGRKMTFTDAVCGTGENTLTLTGPKVFDRENTFEYQAPFRQLSRVTQVGHTARFTTAGAVGAVGGEFRLSSAELALPNAGEYTIDHLAVDGSMSQLTLASGVTLRIRRIDFIHGAPLTIVPTDGGVLGQTIKVIIDGYADDCVDARIVLRESVSSLTPIRFLRHDATVGLVPVTAFDAFVDGGDLGVVSNDATVTVTKDTRMKALVLTGAGVTLNVAEGATLTLGDGTVSGGISISDPSKTGTETGKNLIIGGAGTIAFGARTGVFWLDIARDSAYPGYKLVRLAARTTGSDGMTFANQVPLDSAQRLTHVVVNESANAWTGGARYSGTMMRILNATTVVTPAYVEGVGKRSSRVHAGSGIDNLSAELTLGGAGAGGDGHAVSGNYVSTFTNAVTLSADAGLQADNAPAGWRFAGPVSGPGGLTLIRCTLELTNHNTFAGGLAVKGYSWDDKAHTLNFRNRGNAGTGLLNADSAVGKPTDLSFIGMAGAEFLGPIRATRNLVRFATDDNKPSKMSFLAPSDFAASVIADNVTLGLGAEVSFASMTNQGVTTIHGAGAGGALVLGDGGDWAFAPKFTDTAEAPVTLVTRGAGRVALHRGGNRGGVRIEAGTLAVRGATDIFSSPDLAFRLDAAQNVVADADGNVTKWTSIGPDATEFTVPTFATSVSPTLTADAVMGTRLVSVGGGYNHRLQATRSVTQRTVFLVLRGKLPKTEPVHADHNAGVYGRAGWDFGLRCVTGGLQGNLSGVHFHSRLLRVNGKSLTSDQPHYYFPDDTSVSLVTLVRDVADDARATFAPVLGNYGTWIDSAWFPGAFAEVVAFKSVLDDAEIQQVEKTLAAKWGLTLADEAAAQPAGVLSGDLTIAANGTLDLAGASETVATLAGHGTIRTDADKPAVLRVTGENTFAGTVTGPVTLVTGEGAAGGAAAADVSAAFRDGAQLKLDGASGAIGQHLDAPPVTAGLTLHLDASLPNGVKFDAETKAVSLWQSAETYGPDFVADPTLYGAPNAPVWDATGFDGKPAVHVAQTNAALVATAQTNLTTLVVVYRMDEETTGGNSIFGVKRSDAGLIYDNATQIRNSGVGMDRPGAVRRLYTAAGGWVAYDDSLEKVATPANAPCIVVLSLPTWHENKASYQNKAFCLGRYYNDARCAYYAEILAYERALTEAEITSLGDHLVAKWFGPTLRAREEAFDAASGLAFGPGGGTLDGDFALTGEVTFDFAGLTTLEQPLLQVSGALTLTGATAVYLNLDALARRMSHTYLRAGRLSGDFAAARFPNDRWVRSADETTQSIARTSGLVLIVR